ncbi:transcription termination factor Rho [Calditrichota bacterium GD2]
MSPKKIIEGVLEITAQGHGFTRKAENNFLPSSEDAFVPPAFIKKFKLREGVLLKVVLQEGNSRGRYKPVGEILSVNDLPPEKYAAVPEIKSLTSIDPFEPLKIKMDEGDVTGCVIDLFTPLAKGTRGLIISPPRAGKTTILKHIAEAVLKNHPEVEVMILLIDERPEEVTDFRRTVGANVYFSSSDQSVENHLRIARLTVNMAIRKVEMGKDALVLIDSLTRMGRAFNKGSNTSGRTMSGGLDARALEIPRQFFGAARKIENGGSLTVLATILVETGSRMDDIIFQEFKGTGNMELVLSRACADRRIFPAINLKESGTRKEHKILDEDLLEKSHKLRRFLVNFDEVEAMKKLLQQIDEVC